MSDTYNVQRKTTIDARPEQVYGHLSDFHKWSAWSPWEEMDPNMQRNYAGAESGVGAKYAWQGNRKVGQGNMEITDAKEHSKVDIALNFLKPFKSSSINTFTLEPVGEKTNVTWSMTGPQTLMTKVMGFFKSMDKMVGPDFEKGLAKLKTLAETG